MNQLVALLLVALSLEICKHGSVIARIFVLKARVDFESKDNVFCSPEPRIMFDMDGHLRAFCISYLLLIIKHANYYPYSRLEEAGYVGLTKT